MKKAFKYLLAISVSLNLIGGILLTYPLIEKYYYNKGKVNSEKNKYPFSSHHQTRTSIFNNLGCSNGDILFFGDRLIEIYDWGQSNFPNKIRNRAIQDETLRSLASHISPLYCSPKVILLQIGHNDLLQSDLNLNDLISNLRNLVQIINANKNINKALWLTPIPIYKHLKNKDYLYRYQHFKEELLKIKSEKIQVIDINEWFKNTRDDSVSFEKESSFLPPKEYILLMEKIKTLVEQN